MTDDSAQQIDAFTTPGTLLRAGGAERLWKYTKRDDCGWPDADRTEIARAARSYLDRPEIAADFTPAPASSSRQPP